MARTTCTNPNGEPTYRQTWAVFCMTGTDVRNSGLDREQMSRVIGSLKNGGSATLPDGTVLLTKEKKKGRVKWDKEVKPFTVKSSDSKTWALHVTSKAHDAGLNAIEDLINSNTVTPMIVEEHKNMADDNSPVVKQYIVPGGPCGFAWVNVKCRSGKSRQFITALKNAGRAGDRNSFCEWTKSDYYGGYLHWVHEGGQSLAYKEAYAQAYTKVLRSEGIEANSGSRID